jgi:peptidoglycan/xylan/chitin deacetylase (PgdA/CDA1 family)
MGNLRKYGKGILNRFSNALPLPLLINLTGQKLFLPFYHIISDETVPHVKHLYPIRGARQFEDDLDYLLKYFQPVGVDTLLRVAKGEEKVTKNSFFLSFDDGLREIYDVVAPILIKKGIPATFFINSGFVDNRDLFYRYKASLLIDATETKKITGTAWEEAHILLKNNSTEASSIQKAILQITYGQRHLLEKIAEMWQVDFAAYLNDKQPYLTTTQCLELKNKGFNIGAHSIDHPFYNEITIEEQLRQTTESLKWATENELSTEKLFAFPFTDFNVSRAFFDKLFLSQSPMADLSFGGAGLKRDYKPQHFQRFPMEGTLYPAQNLVSGEYLYYLMKMPFNKNSIQRI